MNSTMEAPTMSSERRKLLIDTDTMVRQIAKRADKSGVTRSGIKIMTALMRIEGSASRVEIAKINGYEVGGVSSVEVNYLVRDDLVSKDSVMVKGKSNAYSAVRLELTGKGLATVDYILTGKELK